MSLFIEEHPQTLQMCIAHLLRPPLLLEVRLQNHGRCGRLVEVGNLPTSSALPLLVIVIVLPSCLAGLTEAPAVSVPLRHELLLMILCDIHANRRASRMNSGRRNGYMANTPTSQTSACIMCSGFIFSSS